MLSGVFKYKGHSYNVEAYDFDDTVIAYLIPFTTVDKVFLDKGIIGDNFVIPAQWDKLYVSVGTGAVYASCYTYIEENDDGDKIKYKNCVNPLLLKEFGGIIRGIKTHCNNSTKVSDGLYDVFNPSREIAYREGNWSACLEVRTLKKLEYNDVEEDVYLFLDEDYDYSVKINKPTSTNHKFALELKEKLVDKNEDGLDWDSTVDDDTVFSLSDIIEANPDKSYVWLNERKYYIVKDIKEVERVCRQIWEHDGLVAFDTETTGLNVSLLSRQGSGDRLVGLVFSIRPGEAWYFPIRHKKIKNICTEDNEEYIINKYFKPILEKKELICHNGSFDWKVMYVYGIFINLVHDTYILFKVSMWNDHRDMRLGLKELTKLILNRDSFTLDDFVKGKFGSSDIKFWDLEEESVKYYACPDTDNLIELYQYCENNDILGSYGAKKIYQIEVAFSLCIAYQEFYGHCVDISKMDDLVEGIRSSKSDLYAKMVEIVGHDFNPRSNVDMPKIMYDELHYPIYEYTSTGNPSCGKKARKKLMDEVDADGNPKYPLAKYLHSYLENSTLESNFTKNIDKFATEDGLMFSEVQQFLETGRVSVKNPNYQSYSDVVKKYIIPRQGYYALDADYSSVEARIMISMAGCKSMIEMMKDPDTDYHTIKASQMFNIPYELVTPKQRKMSKGVNFGILYGLGDPNLGATLYGERTPENTRKAKHQKELYFEGMEELKVFIEKSKAQGVNQHYSTTAFGRRRYFDERKVRVDKIERQSCNARIQGTAADIYKVAMVRLLHQLRKRGWLGRVLISAFVHDECFLEIHKSLDPIIVLGVLRDCMMLNNEGWCPLFIGAGFGRNWYEAKKTEIPVQVQDILINTYGKTGLDWWSGDTDKLCDFINDEIHDYSRDRVINYLRDENNRGKVLSPAVNSLAHVVVGAIEKGIHIDGCVCSDVHEIDDTIDNLIEFGKAFGCEELVENADVKRPVHVEENSNNFSDMDEGDEPDDYNVSWKDVMKLYIKNVGCYYHRKSSDEEKDFICFRYDSNDMVFMRFLYEFFNKHGGDVELFAVKEDMGIYSTGIKVSKSIYPELVKLYTVNVHR